MLFVTPSILDKMARNPLLFHAHLKEKIKDGPCIQYKIWREGISYLLEIFDSRYHYPLIFRSNNIYYFRDYVLPVCYSNQWKFLSD